jgi:uncharacterized membrane protein YdjX (TVP38/TMEM64 family)
VNARKLLFLLAVVAAAAAVRFLLPPEALTLEGLKANRQALLAYSAANAASASALYVLAYAAVTALSLPGAAILSIAGGALFGPVKGTLLAVAAATAGATLSFLSARYVLRDAILGRFGARLEGVNRELESRGFSYLLVQRLVPVFPFFLVNVACGVTRLPLRVFLPATLVGIVPGGFVYVNAGASLASVASLSDVATPRVLGSLALLGLFALVPALYPKMKRR